MKETEIDHNRPACAHICAASGMNGTVVRASLNDLRVESGRSTDFLAPNSKHMCTKKHTGRPQARAWLTMVIARVMHHHHDKAIRSPTFYLTMQSSHQNERDGSGATSDMPHQSFTRVSVCSLCITFYYRQFIHDLSWILVSLSVRAIQVSARNLLVVL